MTIVVLLHVALSFVAFDVPTVTFTDQSQPVHVVSLPSDLSRPDPARVVEPTLVAPRPIEIPAPEFSIDEVEPGARTNDRFLAAAPPPVAGFAIDDVHNAALSGNGKSAGATQQAAGPGSGRLSSGGDAGAGSGSGESAFTKCTNRVMPAYPSNAKLRNQSGKVTLLVQLDERGKLSVLEIARSSGSQYLDNAGIAAIRRWRCSPVLQDGHAVRVIAKQEFEFSLR